MFKFPTKEGENKMGDITLFEPGEYNFTVRSVEDKVSKSGNDMLKVALIFKQGDGVSFVDDYLVAIPSQVHKMKSFLECIGMGHIFDSGEMELEWLVGKTGNACLEQDSYVGRDGETKHKNVIAQYVQSKKDLSEDEKLFDDDMDIPF